MRSKHWLAFAAVIALSAALGSACGDDEEKKEDLCASAQCVGGTTCDPADGVCKCGTGDDRVVCKSNEICQTEPAPTCLQDRCVGVPCARGETCDPTDGVCKCGAFTCSEGEVCSQNRCVVPDPCAGKLCPDGQSCDPTDGACKCGGEICADNERCDEGLCVADPCKGVHCGGLNICNPDDLACHCGTVTGETCSTGQSCNEENGTFFCASIDKCVGVACGGDSVCDPDDGECRCGGVGPDFPICKPDQRCHNGKCVGGDLCSGVECAPGFQCSKDTGECLCGGSLCAEGETCMILSTEEDAEYQCVKECDPFATSVCGDGQTCYLDLASGATVGYCAPTGSTNTGDECALPHNCSAGNTCLGAQPACRVLCQAGPAGDAFCGEEYQGCFARDGNPYGYCLPF